MLGTARHSRVSALLRCSAVRSSSISNGTAAAALITTNKVARGHMKYDVRNFASSTSESTSSARMFIEEMKNRIEQDKDVVRARVLTSEAKQASIIGDETPQRALKDIATDFCEAYMSSTEISSVISSEDVDVGTVKEDVLNYLMASCGIDFASVDHEIQVYQEIDIIDQRKRLALATKLREVCTPPYVLIFNTILASATRDIGLSLLIQLRHDVRAYVRLIERKALGTEDSRALIFKLKQMDSDLKSLLATLFLQPILELRRITYEDTPAAIIEKIAMREAVHPLRSLEDLRTRLGPSRRCFAFFHPSLPSEPLVFVHVALLKDIPSSMEGIDRYASEDNPTVATFYSITSTQPGLSGVDLGNFLIKRVVDELKREFKELEEFCTLSPIPRLRKWIDSKLKQEDKFFDSSSLLNTNDIQILADVLGCSTDNVPSCLLKLLNDASWHEDEAKAKALEPILSRMAAHYLAKEKHRGRPVDGVAKFHIRNGAEMYRLNFLADKSRKGMHNSAGLMINYRYDMNTIEKNNVEYESSGAVPVREGVRKWLEK